MDDTPMKFKKLRIAFSIACILACVLLIGLWVRSYKWRDYCSLGQFANRGWAMESAVGQFAFRNYPINHNSPRLKWWQTAVTDDPSLPTNNRFGVDLYFGHDYAGIVMPFWLLVLLTAIVAALTGANRAIRFHFDRLKDYLRYLRIAFSVACGFACLLLIVLWVRSYEHPYANNTNLQFEATAGRFTCRRDSVSNRPPKLDSARSRTTIYSVGEHDEMPRQVPCYIFPAKLGC